MFRWHTDMIEADMVDIDSVLDVPEFGPFELRHKSPNSPKNGNPLGFGLKLKRKIQKVKQAACSILSRYSKICKNTSPRKRKSCKELAKKDIPETVQFIDKKGYGICRLLFTEYLIDVWPPVPPPEPAPIYQAVAQPYLATDFMPPATGYVQMSQPISQPHVASNFMATDTVQVPIEQFTAQQQPSPGFMTPDTEQVNQSTVQPQPVPVPDFVPTPHPVYVPTSEFRAQTDKTIQHITAGMYDVDVGEIMKYTSEEWKHFQKTFFDPTYKLVYSLDSAGRRALGWDIPGVREAYIKVAVNALTPEMKEVHKTFRALIDLFADWDGNADVMDLDGVEPENHQFLPTMTPDGLYRIGNKLGRLASDVVKRRQTTDLDPFGAVLQTKADKLEEMVGVMSGPAFERMNWDVTPFVKLDKFLEDNFVEDCDLGIACRDIMTCITEKARDLRAEYRGAIFEIMKKSWDTGIKPILKAEHKTQGEALVDRTAVINVVQCTYEELRKLEFDVSSTEADSVDWNLKYFRLLYKKLTTLGNEKVLRSTVKEILDSFKPDLNP